MSNAVNYKEGVIEMAQVNVRTVRVSDETHARLMKLGRMGDTFDGVIRKLLDAGKAEKKAARGRTKVKAT